MKLLAVKAQDGPSQNARKKETQPEGEPWQQSCIRETEQRGDIWYMPKKIHRSKKWPVCSSGWYRSHRENHDVCPRKVEKSKSRKVYMPGDFGSKSRKNRKNRKVEKSKSRKIRKIRKVDFFLVFWLFCENFPWKSDKPRGFWRHWSTGSIHAQGFLWLFGCSFPVAWLVTFQGSRKLAISVSELDFVLLM